MAAVKRNGGDRLTLLQIRYFLKVAERMSFSKAAAELYVSQPSVSRQVKLLEKELGCALFDRTQRNRISLTTAGMVFQESFSGAVQSLEQAKTAALELSDASPLRLRVGIGSGWDLSEPLLRFRDQVLRRNPRASLSFSVHSFRSLREMLQAGELDIILCTKTSILDFTDLEVREVTDLEALAYARRGVFCPESEPLRTEDLGGQTLFMLQEEEAPMAMELVQIVLQARQISVSPVWLPNRETILQAVLMGEGFTVFDQHIYFRDDPRLTSCVLGDAIPICAAWIRGREQKNPLIPLFLEILPELFSE